MKNIYLAILIFPICLLMLSCSGSFPSYKEIKSPEEKSANYSEFCRLIEKIFPNMNIVNVNWDSLKVEYRNKIDSSTSERSFVRCLREIIYKLQDPHLEVITPFDNDILSKLIYNSESGMSLDLDSINNYYGTLPFRLSLVNCVPIVSFVDSTSEEYKEGLRIGMTLARINDETLEDYINNNFISGYRTEMKYSRLITSYLFYRPEGQKIHLGFKTNDNQVLNIMCKYSKKNNKYLYNPNIVKYVSGLKEYKTLEYGRIHNNIGYICIPSFIGKPSYSRRRTILNTFKYDVNQNVKEFENAVRALTDTKALIIDVRDNHGGDESIAKTILSFLVSEPTFYYTARYRDWSYPNDVTKLTKFYPDSVYPLSQYHKNEYYMQYECNYTMPIIVLQSENSLSTTETFLSCMKHIPNVTTLGVKSAGSSSSPEFYALPNGIILRIPRRQTYWDDDKMIEKEGIPPDIEINTIPKDILLTRDIQLEKAIKIIDEK